MGPTKGSLAIVCIATACRLERRRPMANYYHEARAHVRNLKNLETDNKRRAERRAEVANAHAEHPLNPLVVDGRSVKLIKNNEQHAAAERGDGLIPWSAQPDATIDRFDGRALLDMYRDYDLETAPIRPKTVAEERLAQTLVFESYRDLVRLLARGLGEREGLAAAAAENIEIRAAARTAAVAAYAAGGNAQQPPRSNANAAGQGAFAAVGFTYGGVGGGAGTAATGVSSSDDSSSSDDEDEDDQGRGAGADPKDALEVAEERADELAFEKFGIEDFCYRLHKALEQEGEQAERMGRRPRRRHGKKKARERARRMAGQGLNAKDWRDPLNATSFHKGKRAGSRSRSRSRSPPPGSSNGPNFAMLMRGPRAAGALGHLDRKAFERDDNEIIDALPDLPDPAAVANQPRLTDLVTIHGVKPPAPHESTDGMRSGRRGSRSRSRSRDGGRRDDGQRHRGRSRSRSGDRHRSRDSGRRQGRSSSSGRRRRSRSRSGGERRQHRSRSCSRDASRSRHRSHRHRSRSRSRGGSRERSRSRSRSREHRDRRRRSRSRSRDQDRERGRDAGRGGGGAGQAASGSAAPVKPAAATGKAGAVPAAGKGLAPGKTGPAASAAGAASKLETPQERLKRIMAVQLAKQAQKDQAVTHLKRIQVEKEKQARASLDLVVMQPRHRSPSPGRDRSPPRNRGR